MYYVYVAQGKSSGKLRIGLTNDLQEWLREHNNKAAFTKDRVPFRVIYYEVFINKLDAIAREKYLKSGMGKHYLKNSLKHHCSKRVIGNWLSVISGFLSRSPGVEESRVRKQTCPKF